MRSWRVSMLVALALLSTVSAYNGQDGRFMLGLKAGASFASFWGDGIVQFEEDMVAAPLSQVDPAMLIAPTGGVFMALSIIPDFFILQPELLYVRSGKLWDADPAAGANVSLKIYNDYLTIPVLAKLVIPLDAPIMPSAYLGPELSIKLRARAEGLADLPPGTNLGFAGAFGGAEDIGDFVNAADVGLATGIGFDIFMGPGAFVVDLRYAFGFLNIYDVTGGEDIRNSVFSVLGGYALMF